MPDAERPLRFFLPGLYMLLLLFALLFLLKQVRAVGVLMLLGTSLLLAELKNNLLVRS
jgi:hypothetical protein